MNRPDHSSMQESGLGNSLSVAWRRRFVRAMAVYTRLTLISFLPAVAGPPVEGLTMTVSGVGGTT